MTDTTAVTTKKHPLVLLRERFEARRDELKNMLPPDITPDRFIRAMVTAAQMNSDLLATHFLSLWLACTRACRDGLLPDGVEGVIIPYKEKATWIPMYRGLLKKLGPSMRWITTNVVYADEPFEHWVDEHGEHLKHVPGDTFDDAKIVRVYAMGQTKDGGTYVAVLPLAEINKIRKSSRASREDAPWNQWKSEMMKKTALRRLTKLLPTVVELPEDEEEEEPESKPILTPVAPRERGAAAALDLLAGSPESSAEPGETGGGAQAPVSNPTEPAVAADVSKEQSKETKPEPPPKKKP